MNYTWKPIAPLSQEEKQIDVSDVDSLRAAWDEARQRLQQSSLKNLEEFD